MAKTLISIVLAWLLTACGGGGDGGAGGPPVQAPASATVQGVVVDDAGRPMVDVRVAIGATVTTTSANGQYTLAVAPNGTSPTLVKLTRAGYAVQTRTLPQALDPGTSWLVDATMVPVGAAVTFDPAVASTLTVPATRAAVVLPAASLIRGDNAVPRSPVVAQLTVIDPGVDSRVMPGNFMAQGAAGVVPIESFGALHVTFADADGVALNLAPGRSATIRIPAVSRGNAALPTTIPLYHFDERSGFWVQEGSAGLQGSGADAYYEGTVSHFTYWNADIALDTVFVDGCVRFADSSPGAGVRVTSNGADYIGTSSATTSASGAFRIAVKRGATSSLYAQSMTPWKHSDKVLVTVGTSDRALANCFVLGEDGAAPAALFPRQPAPSTSQFAGAYDGTYAGAERGRFAVTVTAGGVLTGSGHSDTFNIDFPISGSVAASGSLLFSAGIAGDAVFNGTLDAATGALAGSWRYGGSAVQDGTFFGQRRP